MKKLICSFIFLSCLFFTGCVEVVEHLNSPVSTWGGTEISEARFFSNGKKECEWLFVFYMDGDNNIESNIFSDLNEVEKGLSYVRDADGKPISGYEDVRCVVLWDGITSRLYSFVYDVGPDENDLMLGSSTFDIRGINFLKKKNYEVDMSNGQTLTDFLNWVNSRYKANHIVLQVADHGSGPGNYTRAMCQDVTSGSHWMTSNDFSNALWKAGYGYMKKKFDCILFDICLGASIEDAYQFRYCADYMIASPDVTPVSGFYYVDVMKCFKKGILEKNLALEMTRTFSENYATGFRDVKPTITLFDLAQVEKCADSINDFASAIMDYKGSYCKFLNSKCEDSVFYRGSYVWLFDIGYFANNVRVNSSGEIRDKAESVLHDLSSVIIYSWGCGKYSSENANQKSYGITISTGMLGIVTDNTIYGIPSWYRTDLDFAKKDVYPNGWGTMMETWFGVGMNGLN
ncbi:MAG: hypothetical protein KBS64_08070 [Treponema sp.]|nr:hypothetical protein [Candidatus Treponema equi]